MEDAIGVNFCNILYQNQCHMLIGTVYLKYGKPILRMQQTLLCEGKELF